MLHISRGPCGMLSPSDTARDARVDTLDVRIMRAFVQDQALSPLTTNFRASLAAVAKRVGEDEDTVRHRLRKIEASGFIRGWRLVLNPQLLGGGQAMVWFEVDPSRPKGDLAEGLRLAPGVLFVHACYDSLIVFLEYEDERSLPRILELVRRLSGAPEVFAARILFPECHAVLTARDWDLLRALRKDPRKSYSDLAAEIGVSSRTARVRLSRLTAQGVAFALPLINMRAAPGGVFPHVLVWYANDRKREVDKAITARVEPYLWHRLHLMPYRSGDLWSCGYDLILPNMAVLTELVGWVREVPGVEKVRTFLLEEIFSYFDSYDEGLERKLSQMPTALPAARVHEHRGPARTLGRA